MDMSQFVNPRQIYPRNCKRSMNAGKAEEDNTRSVRKEMNIVSLLDIHVQLETNQYIPI